MFNKMIVGYDGSEGSRAALAKAVDLMEYKPNTKLLIAYVNDDVVGGDIAYSSQALGSAPILTDMTTVPPVPPNSDSPRQLAVEYANQMTESIQVQLDNHNVHGQIVAVDGHPAKALSDLAEREQADAIIVGNSGKSGFQKFFVGSVSEKIVKDSPCSVIVVK
ncbi:universal stress protein [Paenisporosarcina sp. NPDC076898]|uniref:universal stress protein n=1 Tax=unclassified Paenisporosarcina TaxID=2642018 RepID=UPI003D071F8A